MNLIDFKNISTVILADGQFPQRALPLQVLKAAKRIVCCDGAAKKLMDWGLTPDVIVGDLDSLPSDLRQCLADRIYPSADQETNDLTKAVQWCAEHGIDEVVIVGATGLRDDHTLANISLLAEYAAVMKRVDMITDSGVFTPILASARFDSVSGQQVSIFAITPDTQITTHGLKYAVQHRCFTSWWQGTLNEAETDSFLIEFDKGMLIIFRAFAPTITL